MDDKLDKSNCIVINLKDDKVIFNGVIDGGLYRLIIVITDHKALMHGDGSLIESWHKRFSHLNLNNLKKSQKMVRVMPQFNVTRGGVCDACAMGKHHRNPLFTNDEKLARKPLYCIHSNVRGPMNTPSISRYLYYVTLIDDAIRKC